MFVMANGVGDLGGAASAGAGGLAGAGGSGRPGKAGRPGPGKKIVLWLIAGLAVVLIVAAALWLKQYYDQRYALEDYYYTVVPLDCDFTPVYALDSDGKIMGLKATYNLTGYSADGKARDLEFNVSLDMQDLYPPGTYIKVSASKQWVTDKRALDEADVPATALEKIKQGFQPTSAKTLAAYAEERSRQLSARNTPTVELSCEQRDSTLVYSYVYSAGAKELAEKDGEFLSPVYKAQFRTDKQAFPELTAIFLEIKLTDGTIIFSEKYETLVQFGYEL